MIRAVLAAGGRMIDSAVTLLPQPDSPTSPSVSPSRARRRLRGRPGRPRRRPRTPSRDPRPKSSGACVHSPSATPRLGRRPRRSSVGSRTSRRPSPAARIRPSPSTIAPPGKATSQGEVKGAAWPVADHVAPGGLRRLDTDADVGERRLEEDRGRDAERDVDDDAREDVGTMWRRMIEPDRTPAT